MSRILDSVIVETPGLFPQKELEETGHLLMSSFETKRAELLGVMWRYGTDGCCYAGLLRLSEHDKAVWVIAQRKDALFVV